MSKLISIAHPRHGYSEQISITNDLKGDTYKVSYNCITVNTGSFIALYEYTATGECNTYVLPIQFLGQNNIDLKLSDDITTLEIIFSGNATINNLKVSSYNTPYVEYIKSKTSYWDRILEITNSAGKLRAEAMEGIINMTVNAFANESGTITQENGIMTFLNGTNVADSTQAVQIVGGAIRISDKKDSEGNWIWSTALTGAGINADTITAGTLRAIELSGVKMVASNFTAGNIIGAAMSGGSATFGDIDTGSYMELTQSGDLVGYRNGKRTVSLQKSSEGRLTLGQDLDEYDAPVLYMTSSVDLYGTSSAAPEEGVGITGYESGMEISSGGAHIVLRDGNVYVYTQDNAGTIFLQGNVIVSGYLKAFGGVE